MRVHGLLTYIHSPTKPCYIVISKTMLLTQKIMSSLIKLYEVKLYGLKFYHSRVQPLTRGPEADE